MITTNELREKYLNFFKEKNHVEVPSASLIPENDPTVLFTTAGMQQFVPYFLGQPHPQGSRLVDYQRCLRTVDIDEVGDNRHLTFFEMLGNWSLGDYWKKESISWSWEFLTDHKWLGLDPDKLAVTVFAGNDAVGKDTESYEVWKNLGLPAERIYFLRGNWWPPDKKAIGPGGPDSEIFYDTGKSQTEHTIPGCGPDCDCGRWIEIWNNVFIEFEGHPDGTYSILNQRSVDTGMGLERTSAILSGFDNIFKIDILAPLLAEVEQRVPELDLRQQRITTDHIRAVTFMAMDGVIPSNKDRGYIMRRLLRRVMALSPTLRQGQTLQALVDEVIKNNEISYPALRLHEATIYEVILAEKDRFATTYNRGEKRFEEFAERGPLSGRDAFDLYASFGFPIDATRELAKKVGVEVDLASFEDEFKKHQEISRAGAEAKFKGGLADQSEATIKLHTATHMLQAALRSTLGPHVTQKGSNITPERLRFDFSHPNQLTVDQITATQDLVNQKIKEDLPVKKETVEFHEGEKLGAIGVLKANPNDQVTIYTIPGFSVEFCGGPHVNHTGELEPFKIIKEEAVSSGIRRIKAVLE
jgi:alanyl-tRNA synthetase